jgi:hypothetical protein
MQKQRNNQKELFVDEGRNRGSARCVEAED